MMLPLAFQSDWGNGAVKAALLAWLVAQFIKFTTEVVKSKRFDFTYFVSTGGMPSAHSASVCGLATKIGLDNGFHSAIFALAMWFAMIVMFDAQSVRRAAGEQAAILNQIVEEVMSKHHVSQTKLKELLGHTRVEVFAGMTVGIVVGCLV
ncbi:divergent PAP2 family protein [Kiritimatiellaeota bacterium B1221]|nr:divergent PAP2 family protein [Kiritimatiellaeota bacterium B1221]